MLRGGAGRPVRRLPARDDSVLEQGGRDGGSEESSGSAFISKRVNRIC